MAQSSLDVLLKGSSGRNTRGLLRVIILCTIAAAAVASRLFSVIRKYQLRLLTTVVLICYQDLRVLFTNVRFFAALDAITSTSPRTLERDIDTILLVDPWFNFRATKYLIENGFYSFWDWFDDRKHPLPVIARPQMFV
jgi:dolichyl-diphosphooligosaccharide--protein glycosyltransferase